MIKAFLFDVFGTCVDWRNSVARDVAVDLPDVNALAFADAWRAEYQPAMERIRSGRRGYVPLDTIHRENLEKVAADFDVNVPNPAWLTATWERLDPWPDVCDGIVALRGLGFCAPCSNGSVALMVRLARHAGFRWDAVLGADIAKDYKPMPHVYEASVAALGLQPGEVCMVAAHNEDLVAARAAGLATAFVPRPTEHGPAQTIDLEPIDTWEFVARDFLNLADKVNA